MSKRKFTLYVAAVAYVALILAMAAATFVGNGAENRIELQSEAVYGQWWFSALWALLAVSGVVYFLGRRVRRIGAVLLHAAFVVILVGAFVTHVTARSGIMHLRSGEVISSYMPTGSGNAAVTQLPFSVKLNSFAVENHAGTSTASDYVTEFTVIDGDKSVVGRVSMNHIFTYRGTRFYQTSYDDDMRGSYLTLNHDPWGIGITYAGYLLLALGMLWMLLDGRGPFRSLLRSPLLGKGALVVALMASTSVFAGAATTVPQESARKLAKLDVLYNGRICPFQTFALDFTKKLHGSTSVRGLSAEQVVLGWIFWGDEWDNEPVIKVKNAQMRNRFNLPAMASLHQFFDRGRGGYILGQALDEYRHGNNDAFHKAVADIDGKLQLVMQLRRGEPLKMFPVTSGGKCLWYGPTDSIPADVPVSCREMVTKCFAVLNGYASTGDYNGFNAMVGRMRDYQSDFGGSTLPSVARVKAELTYNSFPFTTVLFIFNLMMGFVAFGISVWRLLRGAEAASAGRVARWALPAAMVVSLATLTFVEALRWVISGTVPMSNGYETMLLVAWLVQVCSLVACRRFRIMLAFGFLLSGFFLLVSHINEMDPLITPVMPVLSSPLLSIHVSVIMASFALLSLTFVCGATALVVDAVGRYAHRNVDNQLLALQLLSRLMLYPALATLAMGIFLGAVWANVSWGQYWGWDPKETWALITLMVYAVAAHPASLPRLQRPRFYHAYMTVAFAVIVMTYFGVNYFLAGMHSYA